LFTSSNPDSTRPRRIVKLRRGSDLVESTASLSVQWKAWLAHTRSDAPSVQELLADQTRRAQLMHAVAAIQARDQIQRQTEPQHLVEPPPPSPNADIEAPQHTQVQGIDPHSSSRSSESQGSTASSSPPANETPYTSRDLSEAASQPEATGPGAHTEKRAANVHAHDTEHERSRKLGVKGTYPAPLSSDKWEPQAWVPRSVRKGP